MSPTSALPTSLADALVGAATRALRNRHLMRAPIHLYRARLGFLFGSRMVLLEHLGRKTGARRRVVLEVIDRPDDDSFVVVSGFGTRSQWFRNIEAEPRVRVQVGSRRPAAATATVLTPDEVAASLQRYATGHARAWRTMKPAIENTLGAPIDERGTGLPMVRLRLDR